MKLLMSLFTITLLIGGFLIFSPGSKGKTETAAASPPKITRPQDMDNDTPPTGVIDGSQHPELIPDQTAYSLLFRLLSNRQTDQQKRHTRAYLRMVFGCSDCGNEPVSVKQAKEARVNGFLEVVRDFERRVGVLDRKAQKFHEKKGEALDARALAELRELQIKKEEIIADLIASLPSRMDAEGIAKLKQHINVRVKSKVKITPPHGDE